LDQIKAWLSEFRAQGFKPWEITLLSFCSEEASAAMQLKKEACKLNPAWMENRHTGYATIHSFKGMENKVIILTDVDLSGRDIERSLFYTGMTRATESVRVLCSESSKNSLISYLQNQ
jgi:superfamily I DNA/RNA helicase